MNQPQEQYAQYGGMAIKMHSDNVQGEGGIALVLTHRTAQHIAQAPVHQTGERTQRPVQTVSDELDNDSLYKQRIPSSTRRYAPVAAPQGQTRVRIQHHSAPVQRRVIQDYPFQPSQLKQQRANDLRPRPHWLRFVGGGMLFMFFGWVALSSISSWWMTMQDDWHYGRPRTYQTDAVVGHHDNSSDPSHFIVENFNRHVVIIEFQGGDPRKAVSYVGPTLVGEGQDLTPVTISFRNVNHDGKPDMILQSQDSHLVFLNTGTAFRPATSADHVTL